MMNGCSENTEAEVAERNERAKKLYRYVTDVARRIDEATASCRSVSDLFTTKFEVQRQKLRDNCEKLMFLDPLSYGKKSLELLWRKVYYDTVSAAKKHQDEENACDNYLFTHIVCGIGHLHHIISRIQSEMKVQFNMLDYTPLQKDEESEELDEVSHDDDLQLFGRSILHSCLIYLGDLTRYQTELFHTFDPSIAARYYLQAAHIDMSSGMPYNQLGNLYQDKNHNLDSVCYYIQCLSCTVPFDGALANLTKLLEKNTQYSDSLDNSETTSQAEHIQNTIAYFLSLIQIWYLGKDDTDIPQKCNMIAHHLRYSMDFIKLPLPDINKNYDEYLQAVEEEILNPSHLTSNIIHKLIQICLFTVAKVNETDEKKAFACKAFTLALLSQLLQKLLQQLHSLGLKNPADLYTHRTSLTVVEPEPIQDEDTLEFVDTDAPVAIEEENKETSSLPASIPHSQSDEGSTALQNGDVKANKKTLAKRRRRRRTGSESSGEDSGTEGSKSETEETISDEDALSDSSYDSENGEGTSQGECSDTEEVPTENQNGNGTEDKSNSKNMNGDVKDLVSNSQKQTNPKSESQEIPKLNETDIQNFLRGDNFLPSIKLLQDWVLNEKELVKSCGDSGEALFQCIVDLLNIFTYYFKPNMSSNDANESCKILDYATSVAKKLELEYRTIPLPEDLNLRGTNICKFDKDAAEWQLLKRYKPSIYEENIIRILQFIDFGNQIAAIVPRIRFNRSMQIMYLKKTPAAKLNTKIAHKRSKEWHNSNATQPPPEAAESGLLRRLGRLWLASRVRELERSGRACAAAAPTLLALDSAALHKQLRRIKQLMRAKIFILLVPTVVVQELDELKRTSSHARDAIRWLEAQLQGGSRFVRAQRPGQARPLPLLKYPRKLPPHLHNYIQILEFCHHFVADERGGNGDPDSKSSPLLVLLTGDEPAATEHKELSVAGAARAAGVSVATVDEFYGKWRRAAHEPGKKR